VLRGGGTSTNQTPNQIMSASTDSVRIDASTSLKEFDSHPQKWAKLTTV
jgi:hypothetical protein